MLNFNHAYNFRFLNRASYHFRNSILDFDVLDELILISCFSDGLDVLCYMKDNLENIKLSPVKGDKISRSCISCLWINRNMFLASDKHNCINLCEIYDNVRWIFSKKSFKIKELVVKLFKTSEKVFCETISGSIIDISNEFEYFLLK